MDIITRASVLKRAGGWIAPQYDPSTTYAEGDIVMKDNKMVIYKDRDWSETNCLAEFGGGSSARVAETYTIAVADWSALASSAPYTYSATVTATHTIGENTICQLINNNAVLFANHGFAIGSVSNQSVTIYSIGAPSASVTLEVDYNG